MEQVIKQLRVQFPLLTRLMVGTKDIPEETQPLPLFLGILLAAMDSKNATPSCFVLPRREQTAPLAAIVFGLKKFIEDFHRLDREIAEKNFTPGQNVFVCPLRKIYRYLGIYEENPRFIKLGIIGKTDWQTFPLSDIRRLEVTESSYPPGKLGSIIALAKESPFEQLMAVNTSGSFSAFLNHVLLLDYKSDFEALAANVCFQKSPLLPDMPPLDEMIPLGSISQPKGGENVRFSKLNFLNQTCEPLVAVTSSPDKMVAACRAATPRSKVVIVNGLGMLASQLQAYDEIAETQKLVIIAEHEEQEYMQALADRNCKFWWLGQREILMGLGNGEQNNATTGFWDPVIRSARNEAAMAVESEVCEDDHLNDIAARLVGIDEAAATDETGTIRGFISRLFRLLNDVASMFQPPTKDELQRFYAQISGIRRDLEREKHWIGEPANEMAHICDLFDIVFSGSNLPGEAKGSLLWKVLRGLNGGTTGLLARNASHGKLLKQWLRRFIFNVPVFTSSTVPNDVNFDCVVCIAWPGSDAFQRVARHFITPRIKVIGYAFEGSWLNQCHRKLRQRPQLPVFTQAEKSDLMKNGQGVRIVWPDDPEGGGTQEEQSRNPFSILEFENRIRSVRKGGQVSSLVLDEAVAAKYVGFRGDSFARITTGHKLPIVTDLLIARPGMRQKTPMKEIEQVRGGDFAVFRDGGNRDVVHVIADRQLQRSGHNVAALRRKANLWVEALRNSGLNSEQILEGLANLGFAKNLPTIRNWLFNTSIIGPGSQTDLDYIAKLTKSRELDESKADVWAAIKLLRGAHLSAGTWLTDILLQKLPSCLGEIEEHGTKINIDDVVTAWVVQVEDIDSQYEQFPRSSVNRLLWDRSRDPDDQNE